MHERHFLIPSEARRFADFLSESRSHLTHLYPAFTQKTEALLPILSLAGLAIGVVLGSVSETFSAVITSLVSGFIDGYSYIAPGIIFLILAPALSRIVRTRQRGRFALYVIRWVAVAKILASLWAILFTVGILGLPILPRDSHPILTSLGEAGVTLGKMALLSPYFWAIYASLGMSFLTLRVPRIGRWLDKGVSAIESSGQYFQPVIPLFMLAVGAYVQALPQSLRTQLDAEGLGVGLIPIQILWFNVDPNSGFGMVTIYVIGSLLVALACFVWHGGLLLLTRFRSDRFSLKVYFTEYWIKAYPLLWATSSESLATPLNLYLVKKHAPWVKPTVRRFIAGAGSYMSINGTLISVFVLAGVVGRVMGMPFTLVDLLLAVPVVFLISYGVPGIPGELLLFAGPLAMILGVPEAAIATFLALYIGLQIGLPDSFRTGSNSTDDYVQCVLLNETYEKRYGGDEAEGEEEDE